VFTPLALPVVVVALALWALLGVGDGRGAAAIRGLVATVAAIPLLVPWILYADLGSVTGTGQPAFWDPSWAAVVSIGVAALGAILGGDRIISAVGAWGAMLAVIGAVVARTGDLGSGTDVLLAGLAATALGSAIVAGAALEAGTRRREVGGWRGSISLVGAVAAGALVLGTSALAGPGRAGIPEDVLTGSFSFAAPEGGSLTRVLLFGPPDSLPGESRDFDGLGYRVFIPPYPASWEAYLNEERLGDVALDETLASLVDGQTRRAGAELAKFGIGWIAFTEPSPLEQLFEAQLDLVTLRSLDFPVFRNEASAPIVVSGDGSVWHPEGAGFASVNPTGVPADVLIASNADFRWGAGQWEQADWANQLVGVTDAAAFTPHGGRRLAAVGALVWFILLGGAAVAGRVRKGRS
jgi:hypothetical protein